VGAALGRGAGGLLRRKAGVAPRRIEFGWEPLAEILAEPNIRDLLVSYYEELSPLAGIFPIDVDWDELLRRDRAGAYAVWTVHVAGTLAGFVSFYLQPHLFHRTVLAAIDAGHYLSPTFRDQGRIGYRLWKTAIAALEERGVKYIMAHDNSLRPLLPFFLALGFEPRSTIFWKVYTRNTPLKEIDDDWEKF